MGRTTMSPVLDLFLSYMDSNVSLRVSVILPGAVAETLDESLFTFSSLRSRVVAAPWLTIGFYMKRPERYHCHPISSDRIMTSPEPVPAPFLRLDMDLGDPGPLPEDAVAASAALMKTGRLHRYGEYAGTEPHVDLLEREYAGYMGSRYAVAVNSGGCALFLALKSVGVGPGDPVLVNAFNLAPVPGAIEHAGARAVLVEVNDDFLVDPDDLVHKARQSGAKVLLLTHMRGHIADMEALSGICAQLGLTMIEDCAHTMGARWNGRPTGRFGTIGCFSTQTFKHINSGEGGMLVTDDDDCAARAILYSGSYMLYGQHGSSPPEAVFDRWKMQTPNYSMRMSNLVACILRPQLREMPRRERLWNERYRWLEERLNRIDGIRVPARDRREQFVASSIQFHAEGMDAQRLQAFADNCTARGVAVKWFGRSTPMGYTSLHRHWGYLEPQSLPGTDQSLSDTCDMRIPLSLTEEHCNIIAAIIQDELSQPV